jgi:hypothetical protein
LVRRPWSPSLPTRSASIKASRTRAPPAANSY